MFLCILIREIHKALTLIDSYGRQTTEGIRMKRAPRAKVNFHVPRALNIEVVIILTNSSFIDTMAVVVAVLRCFFRVF